MKEKSYELGKFNRTYLIFGGSMLCLFAACCIWVLDVFGWKLYALLAFFVVFEIVIYAIARKQIAAMSNDIRHVTDIMTDILEGAETIANEEYKSGEIGMLYTNLFKLVMALKQSNLKEQEEKIFLRDIISDISHQLKTPLASLTVFLDLLCEGRVSDENKQKQMLQESRNQITRMEWMVLSMLKLARIEAGAIQFDMRSCDLGLLAAQAVEGVAYLTNERRQTVQVDIEPETKLVCDGDWLVEAMINLLKNASDYSKPDTEIDVWAEANPMYIRIYIKDHGIGISEEDQKHIFKRFYRANNEVNPNSVGIGLSLTKSIIEGMGGKISVRSELSEYTEFVITFVHTG